MIVADTSAWVEYLRATGHPADITLTGLIEEGENVAVTEVVVMELLAGGRERAALRELRSRLLAFPILRLEGLGDFEEAARIYRLCAARGRTIASQMDCLVAVPAIRAGASLLHNDTDFETIASVTTLRVEPYATS